LVSIFLKRNGFKLTSVTKDNVEMSLAVEADQWKVDEVEAWLRQHTAVIS
jgi:prophage maintenance system killer protein